MFALINVTKSISRTLDYNEQKLRFGTAELLLASGFIKSTERLSYPDKLRQFERYTSLNERTLCNTLHISLNFDLSDVLTKEKLIDITVQYMETIGFGFQPFLVYQHFDSAHPHVHIVTINIQKDGSRISVHFLCHQSMKARKEIETQFGLKKAEKSNPDVSQAIPSAITQKVIYGRHPTKQSISHVLKEVIDNYKFSSLPEFNAILKLFNVMADRGRENSNMFKWKGLLYRVLDDDGRPIGTPIKASMFYHKPTLALLERKFIENNPLKQASAKRIIVEIEFALAKSGQTSLPTFIKELEKSRICPVLRKNKEEYQFEIVYVDFKTKTAFNGIDLGIEYGTDGILNRLGLSRHILLPMAERAMIQTRQKISSGEPDRLNERTSGIPSDRLLGATAKTGKPISISV